MPLTDDDARVVREVTGWQQRADSLVAQHNIEAQDMSWYFAHRTEMDELLHDLAGSVPALLGIIERLRAENEALTARLERPF